VSPDLPSLLIGARAAIIGGIIGGWLARLLAFVIALLAIVALPAEMEVTMPSAASRYRSSACLHKISSRRWDLP